MIYIYECEYCDTYLETDHASKYSCNRCKKNLKMKEKYGSKGFLHLKGRTSKDIEIIDSSKLGKIKKIKKLKRR